MRNVPKYCGQFRGIPILPPRATVMSRLSQLCLSLNSTLSSPFRRINIGRRISRGMGDESSLNSNGKLHERVSKIKIEGARHPHVPKAKQPSIKKNEDGSWGPTGLYGTRIQETELLGILRSVIKPSRLKRVEEVLAARSNRVQCLFENLHDPANGAACLRTMEGFGVLNAHAVESYEPFKVPGGITMNAEKVRGCIFSFLGEYGEQVASYQSC